MFVSYTFSMVARSLTPNLLCLLAIARCKKHTLMFLSKMDTLKRVLGIELFDQVNDVGNMSGIYIE